MRRKEEHTCQRDFIFGLCRICKRDMRKPDQPKKPWWR